jgi:hypothetical protein
LHLIRLFFYLAKVPIINHPRQPAGGRHPFLHSAQNPIASQDPLEQAHVSRAAHDCHLKINRAIATRRAASALGLVAHAISNEHHSVREGLLLDAL